MGSSFDSFTFFYPSPSVTADKKNARWIGTHKQMNEESSPPTLSIYYFVLLGAKEEKKIKLVWCMLHSTVFLPTSDMEYATSST